MITDVVMKEFIDLIRHERWTVRYAASKIGFSQSYVTDVINRREKPSCSFLTKVFFLLVTYQKPIKRTRRIKTLR